MSNYDTEHQLWMYVWNDKVSVIKCDGGNKLGHIYGSMCLLVLLNEKEMRLQMWDNRLMHLLVQYCAHNITAVGSGMLVLHLNIFSPSFFIKATAELCSLNTSPDFILSKHEEYLLGDQFLIWCVW